MSDKILHKKSKGRKDIPKMTPRNLKMTKANPSNLPKRQRRTLQRKKKRKRRRKKAQRMARRMEKTRKTKKMKETIIISR